MKKAKAITITLPHPCEEDWDQMKPVGCGRFCGQCQKNVIDFTVLSDDMIARLLCNPANGQLCGRFSEEQLNRPIPLPAPPPGGWLRPLAAAAVFLAPYFTAAPAIAQPETKVTLNGEAAGTTAPKPIRIKGRISDALTGQPMTRMAISIDSLGTQYSDRYGRFSFTIPGDWTGKTVTLKAAYHPLSTAPKDNTIILEETVTIETGKRLYEAALMRYPAGNGTNKETTPITAEVISSQTTRYSGVLAKTESVVYRPSLWQKITRLFKFKKRNHKS
jgi:hypothetical protein